MQKLISQIPQLSHFLSRVPKSQHESAIKQVIRIGLKTFTPQCCNKQNQRGTYSLTNEINLIKQNLDQLNHIVRCRCQYNPPFVRNQRFGSENMQPQRDTNHNIHQQNKSNTFSFKKPSQGSNNLLQPLLSIFNKNTSPPNDNKSTVNPFLKNKLGCFRHHLDDTKAKQALEFPAQLLIQKRHPSKRKSQDYKKHIYQDEINKQQQQKVKQQRGDFQEERRRSRAVTDYSKTTSKIKNLLDKDRIRYVQRQRQEEFREGFNKYQYSDENQMEESSIPDDSQPQQEDKKSNRPSYEENTYNQHYHSSFKASNPASSSQKASSRKQFQRSKKQISSKLQASQNQPSQKFQSQGKNSQAGKLINNNSQKASDKYKYAQQQQQQQVISNSSSFSQFSISGSQKRDVGKISRRSNN